MGFKLALPSVLEAWVSNWHSLQSLKHGFQTGTPFSPGSMGFKLALPSVLGVWVSKWHSLQSWEHGFQTGTPFSPGSIGFRLALPSVLEAWVSDRHSSPPSPQSREQSLGARTSPRTRTFPEQLPWRRRAVRRTGRRSLGRKATPPPLAARAPTGPTSPSSTRRTKQSE